MFKDYYTILDATTNSDIEEIKKAYKKQAIKWHPDRNPNKDTTQRMQDINEAYLILKDLEARIKYDLEYHIFKSRNQEIKKSDMGVDEQKENMYNYGNYTFDDEILKKWVSNARTQAKNILDDVIDEFRGATVEGGKSILDYAISYLIPMIVGILIFKACNS
jgi:curved DNA-binding protein CbpA